MEIWETTGYRYLFFQFSEKSLKKKSDGCKAVENKIRIEPPMKKASCSKTAADAVFFHG